MDLSLGFRTYHYDRLHKAVIMSSLILATNLLPLDADERTVAEFSEATRIESLCDRHVDVIRDVMLESHQANWHLRNREQAGDRAAKESIYFRAYAAGIHRHCPDLLDTTELKSMALAHRIQRGFWDRPMGSPTSRMRFDISNRANAFKESLDILQTRPVGDFCCGVSVAFLSEKGSDFGGVRREWFTLITREILSPSMGLFQEDPDTRKISIATRANRRSGKKAHVVA